MPGIQDENRINLLYGSDGLRRKVEKQTLLDRLGADLDDMNKNIFEGKETDINAVLEMADTMPFFADRRVIVVENTGWFSSAGEKLADYLEQIPDTTYIIFVEENPDKRSRLYKACVNKGHVTNCEMLKDDKLQAWIIRKVQREKKNITKAAYEMFVERTNTDMFHMSTELDKLLSYVGEKDVIDVADVEAICTVQITSKVFDLVDEIARKNQTKALHIYGEMLALKEAPLFILYQICRQFNQLLIAKELKQKGFDKFRMGERMGLNPYVADKCAALAAKFSTAEIRCVLEEGIQTEEDIKQGRIEEGIGTELIIIKFSKMS